MLTGVKLKLWDALAQLQYNYEQVYNNKSITL